MLMGIFTGLFRSRDKPQNRTAGSTYSFFFGGSTSGKPVNERTATPLEPEQIEKICRELELHCRDVEF